MSAAGELLQAAKELLAKGKCVGAAARDKDDNACDPTSEEAAKFSIYGALTRAAYDRRDSTGIDAALLLLGASDLHDPHLDGFAKSAEDDTIAQRFEEAIARADQDPEHVEAPEADGDEAKPQGSKAEGKKPGLLGRLLGKSGAEKAPKE